MVPQHYRGRKMLNEEGCADFSEYELEAMVSCYWRLYNTDLTNCTPSTTHNKMILNDLVADLELSVKEKSIEIICQQIDFCM